MTVSNSCAVLTVRIYAGFNASSMLAGLLALSHYDEKAANHEAQQLFPKIQFQIHFGKTSVHGISGYTLHIDCPPEKGARHPSDIEAFYSEAPLSESELKIIRDIWSVLINAEASVHGTSPAEVHFHEVGRCSNLIAIGLIARLYSKMAVSNFVSSPIPVGDASITCAHGAIPYPAPSAFAMMKGIPVRPWKGEGEAVTPTGLAVLIGLGAHFGAWPEMLITERETVFCSQTFDSVPNGALFILGEPFHD